MGIHSGSQLIGGRLSRLLGRRGLCRVITVGQRGRAVVPHNASHVRSKSVIFFAAAGDRVRSIQLRTNGQSPRMGGIVVVNKDHVTVHAYRCLPGGVHMGMVRAGGRGDRHVTRIIPKGILVVGKSKHSASLLVRRKVGSTRTFVTLASGSDAGVLTYLTTGHTKMFGAVTGVRGVSCVPLTRDVSVNSIVGGGLVTTDRVCRFLLSTSISGIGYLAFTGTSITRLITHPSSGVAHGRMGSLGLPGSLALNKLVHSNRPVVVGNSARVRTCSRIIIFYLSATVHGLRSCFGWLSVSGSKLSLFSIRYIGYW